MNNQYQISTISIYNKYRLTNLINFLNTQGLDFDNNVNFTVIIKNEKEQIIATGSLDTNIIKCLAVAPNHRNEGLSATIVSYLINKAASEGIRKLFVYTKCENEDMFKDLGFYAIEKTNKILLMENIKNGFTNYLNNIKKETEAFIHINNIQPKKIGCIIANCNPFTKGHLYLMETSAKKCDLLHVFVLSGSNKFFTEEERVTLVKQGIKNHDNIIVHYAKDYILSPLTFPTYFIKEKIQTSNINCELDVTIFINKIAPLLNITHRFLGTESNDLVTKAYNDYLTNALKHSNVELEIIDREKVGNIIISASKVRKYIENKEFDKIKDFVPKTTYEFILNKFKL
ncbi:MAG: [citrate (pro-3S)-lyase] ligase [Sphaerochaetaceae bacterium]|nr:[citrate (pro-3S)-lyase] ligase [Sphaerochaetaceae bacterium]